MKRISQSYYSAISNDRNLSPLTTQEDEQKITTSKRFSSAFTIVELLIVVVVIAILASVVIVGYNGITKRAIESDMKLTINEVSKKVMMDKELTGGAYGATTPADLPGSITSDGTKPLHYYQRGGGAGYCTDITSTKYSDLQFYIDENGSIQKGLCTESAPVAATPAACFDTQDIDGGVMITAYNGGNEETYTNNTDLLNPYNSACPADVVIPSEIGGKAVLALSDDEGNTNSFYGRGIRSVIIPDTVISLGANTFLYDQLTSVVIPSSVTSIGNQAFSDNQLTSVTIPSSVSSIGDQAFANNQIASVTIPSSVTSIGGYTFSNNLLTSVTIPSSVIFIGSGAFTGNQLTSVVIPSSITTISPSTFYANQLTSVTIPSSVTSIGSYAFTYNQLTSVTIPSSVTSIGDAALSHKLLTSVSLRTGTSLGVNAFDPSVVVTHY